MYVCVCVCVCVCIHTILLRVPWTAKRSNQSVLKEINSKYSLEGLMLKVKLQYFGHPMQRANSLEKTLMLKDWGQEKKGVTNDERVGWHHQLNWHELEQIPRYGESEAWCAAVHGRVMQTWDCMRSMQSQTGLSNWTTEIQDHVFSIPFLVSLEVSLLYLLYSTYYICTYYSTYCNNFSADLY